MIRYHLGASDLAQTRFAFSPLWETIESVAQLIKEDPPALHEPWLREARRSTAHLDLEPLMVLVRGQGMIPDFLLPPPLAPSPRFADELERVRAMPPEQVVREVAMLYGTDDPPPAARPYLDRPEAALAAVADLIARYWDACLAQHWPRLTALLEGDLLYRSRVLALQGAEALFDDLHPMVRYADGVLEVDKFYDADVHARGRGLLLLPVAFCWPKLVVTTEEPIQPTIGYSPRGAGSLWEPLPLEVGDALRSLVGPGRAAVLQSLPGPRSTGELAGALGVTSSAVSQHLGHLRRLGLVEPQRLGRRVYYRRSSRGEELMQLFAT